MPTRRARLRRRIYSRLPKWLKNHDFEVFAAVLSIFAGLPILFGQVEPSSPEELLPPVVVYSWAVTLVLGGLSVLLALIYSNRSVFPRRVFWMRMEALGMTAMAYVCYVYCVCILLVAMRTAWSAAMLILAFGLICHIRNAAIQEELENYRKSLGLSGRA